MDGSEGLVTKASRETHGKSTQTSTVLLSCMNEGDRGVEDDELEVCSATTLLLFGVSKSLLRRGSEAGTAMVVPTTSSGLATELLVRAVCIDGDGEVASDAMVDYFVFRKKNNFA